MFIDSRRLDQRTVLQSDICIVGGGVAGIVLARELGKQGISVCLLESGGFEPDDATRDLNRGESRGMSYRFADGCRSRYLGGSSNCWGGWCRPFDAEDFEYRDWVPHSGWPFGLSELAPYYERTHELLALGPDNYDAAYWEALINRSDVRRIPQISGRVRDTISQFSTPVRFGKRYRDELRRSLSIRVFLHANAVEIQTDHAGRTVACIRGATLNGRTFSVKAKHFVLAAGGIENARLLLASNRTHAAGVGNGDGLVGRYFMDHPRLLSGSVRLRESWTHNRLYDIKYHHRSRKVSAFGTRVAAQLALTPAIVRQERLLNARVWLSSVLPGEGSAGAQALYRCKQALRKKACPDMDIGHDIATMLRQPLDTFSYGISRLFRPRAMVREVKLQAIVEPAPDPDSRVYLSAFDRDSLGMPRVCVDWRLGEQVKQTFDRTLAIVADELTQGGVAEVSLDPPLLGQPWPATLDPEGTWHHMGTTRMHNSPRQGVVDRNCQVHGMSNLFIAGSSVFPTAGVNFPTMTLAALALRLSEYLIREINTPQPVVVNNIGSVTLAPAGSNMASEPVCALPLHS